jgi:hypothetical protein
MKRKALGRARLRYSADAYRSLLEQITTDKESHMHTVLPVRGRSGAYSRAGHGVLHIVMLSPPICLDSSYYSLLPRSQAMDCIFVDRERNSKGGHSDKPEVRADLR